MLGWNANLLWLALPVGALLLWAMVSFQRERRRAQGSRWATWLDEPRDASRWFGNEDED